MTELLAELEAALRAQEPPLTAAFADPATPEAIRNAERDLGVAFPDDLRAFLLCADGQQSRQYSPVGDYIVPEMRIAGGGRRRSAWGYLLGVEGIVRQTRFHFDSARYADDDRGRRLYGPVSRHHNHLILTSADDPVTLALDLSPAEGGAVGQVVTFNDQPDYTACLAPSLSAFLRLLVDGYRAGRFARAEDGTVAEVSRRRPRR